MQNRTAAPERSCLVPARNTLAEIRRRPCPRWCSKQTHRYTATRREPWALERIHKMAIPLNGRKAVVTVESLDEFYVGSLRGKPDEDYIGEPLIFCDERFLADGFTARESRRFADKVQTLADQLRAAADRLDEVTRGQA